MKVLPSVLKFMGKRKIRLGSGIMKVAAVFVDYESEHLPPNSRVVEDSYVFSKLMGMKDGKAVDVGCVARHNYISPALALSGWDVYGVDIRSEWQFHHPNFHFLQEDIRHSTLPSNDFDLVTCVSTLEHIGLVGYYGNQEEVINGDAQAITQIKRILKPNGILLLTVPYANKYSVRPGVRVYNMFTLNKILVGFTVIDKVIYLQDKMGDWDIVDGCDAEGVICLQLKKN
jgi:SAM-dependent methyltransferase